MTAVPGAHPLPPAAHPGGRKNSASKDSFSSVSPLPADSIESAGQKSTVATKTDSKHSSGGRSGGSGVSGRPPGSGNIDIMQWEVQYSELTFKEVLGKGSFGKVRRGSLCWD